MKEGSLAQNCTEDDGSDDDDEEDDGPDETTDERIHDAAADIAMSLNIEQWVAVIYQKKWYPGYIQEVH